MNFENYLKVILLHEGGLSNHPKDKGLITKYGVSLRFLRKQGIDIDKDGDIDADDILGLTVHQAGVIYKQYFFEPLHALPDGLLKLHVFDMGVNAGTRRAIKLLQYTLGVEQDGVIGKQTLKALLSDSKAVEKYIKARIAFYNSLVESNSDLSVFLRGWLRRVKTTTF